MYRNWYFFPFCFSIGYDMRILSSLPQQHSVPVLSHTKFRVKVKWEWKMFAYYLPLYENSSSGGTTAVDEATTIGDGVAIIFSRILVLKVEAIVWNWMQSKAEKSKSTTRTFVCMYDQPRSSQSLTIISIMLASLLIIDPYMSDPLPFYNTEEYRYFFIL